MASISPPSECIASYHCCYIFCQILENLLKVLFLSATLLAEFVLSEYDFTYSSTAVLLLSRTCVSGYCTSLTVCTLVPKWSSCAEILLYWVPLYTRYFARHWKKLFNFQHFFSSFWTPSVSVMLFPKLVLIQGPVKPALVLIACKVLTKLKTVYWKNKLKIK